MLRSWRGRGSVTPTCIHALCEAFECRRSSEHSGGSVDSILHFFLSLFQKDNNKKAEWRLVSKYFPGPWTWKEPRRSPRLLSGLRRSSSTSRGSGRWIKIPFFKLSGSKKRKSNNKINQAQENVTVWLITCNEWITSLIVPKRLNSSCSPVSFPFEAVWPRSEATLSCLSY